MGEDKNRGARDKLGNIEEILRERERFNQISQKEFGKEVAILLPDMRRYIEYIDVRGDISGPRRGT